MSLVALEYEGWRLQLDPSLGGSVLHLQHGDVELLRPASTGYTSPLDCAAFPLVPFVGRIDHGRFRVGHELIDLDATPGAEPHALHGHGWLAPWKIRSRSQGSVSFGYEHAPDAWPWRYLAEQIFSLDETSLALTLSVTNLSDSAMPAGLGWHSYFRKEGARLHAPVQRWWPGSADDVPTVSESIVGRGMLEGVDVADLGLDSAFQRVGDLATVDWPHRGQRVTLETSANLRHCLVYTPEGEDYFCYEPVSHAPNAHNSHESSARTGLGWLGEGETLSATIRLRGELPTR